MQKFYFLFIIVLLYASRVDAQGIYKLSGITQVSGDDNLGTIFSATGTGDNYQLQYQFTTKNPGAQPQAVTLTSYNGKFYGLTTLGGRDGSGVIFEWDQATNIYTKKFSFNGNDGSGPVGSLLLYAGKFYGITTNGGTGDGVIFQWDPATNIYTKRFEFSVLDDNGYWPKGNLALNAGKLYGMTARGGTSDKGVIFELDLSTNVFTKKIDFNGANGGEPYGSLVFSGSKFYGMTTTGGTNNKGVIFQWDLATNVYTKKIDFNGVNGSTPYGSMYFSNSKFYGMTQRGNATDNGVIFEWDPNTNQYTKKYEFGANGYWPSADLVIKGGKFYSMTERGGSNDAGVIFEWDPVTNIYAKKINMGGANGKYPNGNLTLSGSKFYGMTTMGGSSEDGVIFEWDPAANSYNKKIDLNDNGNGIYPTGNLVAANGKWYGVTNDGGTNDAGVIFEWEPNTDVYTKKIDFSAANGSKPYGAMSLNNGKFYGTTSGGGVNDEGVIFEWDPVTNMYTKKIDLNWNDGIKNYSSMALNNGKFYAITYEGGANGGGVIFEWDPLTNIYTKKTDLNSTTGYRATGSLTYTNGKFYGMTYKGGSSNNGVIFEWDPATNVYTRKFDFGSINGTLPAGSMVLANGKLYGLTSTGGSSNWGVIFEWDPATNVYTKKFDFTNSADGNKPYGSLTFSSGKFYGTTKFGGANSLGVMFEWDPATNVYTKKKDLSGTSTGSFPGVINNLSKLAAPVAKGSPNNCTGFASVTIDNSNNNIWVPIIDSRGDAVAEIKANGNNLGIVTASMFINEGPVREDGFKKLYLDRNLTLTPAIQPASPVDVRLYVKNSEYLALKNAFNSMGQSSSINSIGDIGVVKNADNCSAVITSGTTPVGSSPAAWETDHVFSVSTNSLSSFYFFSMTQGGPLAVTRLEFNGRLTNNNAALNWKTTDEQNTSSFDLERSTNGMDYSKIINTKAVNLPGVHQYDYTDKNIDLLGSPAVYYRLRKNDIDHKFDYTNVVVFNIKHDNVVLLYPNPVKDQANLMVTINKPEVLQVRLLDNNGRLIKAMQWKLSAGKNSFPIDVTGLASSIYYVELKGQTINERKRFIKQ